uniref:VWFD domain-containing protein n=1 Tax=Eptatretus burgeri TaxID=7764 RepID=A0A8C4R0V3_EPTBU
MILVFLHTSPCGQAMGQVCVKAVSLELHVSGGTSRLMITRSGELFIGSQHRVGLPYFGANGVSARSISSLFLELNVPGWISSKLEVGTGPGGRVYVETIGSHFRGAAGLCMAGYQDHNPDFLSPAGVPEPSLSRFAASWRLSGGWPIHPLPRVPPDPCEMNHQSSTFAAEACSVLGRPAFSLCHSKVPLTPRMGLCRQDGCVCGWPCVCAAIADYARLCTRLSVPVSYLHMVSDCAVTCPDTMQFHTCAPRCPRTCRSLSLPHDCERQVVGEAWALRPGCEAGCDCLQGMFYHELQHTCVQRSQCPCYFMDAVYTSGEATLTQMGTW